jgi:hypothetical protein
MTATQTKYYRLLDSADQPLGDYAACDLREAVDRLANGKPWGWRAGVDGHADAICDYVVIAQAYPLEA